MWDEIINQKKTALEEAADLEEYDEILLRSTNPLGPVEVVDIESTEEYGISDLDQQSSQTADDENTLRATAIYRWFSISNSSREYFKNL